MTPYEGANLIARLGYDLKDDLVQDRVMTFVALEDEHSGGWGRTRDDVEAEILGTARKIVAAR